MVESAHILAPLPSIGLVLAGLIEQRCGHSKTPRSCMSYGSLLDGLGMWPYVRLDHTGEW